jgi:hypothetical protein
MNKNGPEIKAVLVDAEKDSSAVAEKNTKAAGA